MWQKVIIPIIILTLGIVGIIGAISVMSNKKVIPEQQSQTENVTNNNSNNKRTHNIITIVVSVLIIIAILFVIVQCSDNDSDTYSATCQVCHKTYSYEGHEYGGISQRNVKCIKMTNMCKGCYESYCYSIGKTPKDYWIIILDITICMCYN